MLEIKSRATFHMELLKVNWALWSQFYHETGNKAQMNREINQESMISREMNVRTKEKELKFSKKKEVICKGRQQGKKTFSFGHCLNDVGGSTHARIFCPFSRSAFLVNKKSLFLH